MIKDFMVDIESMGTNAGDAIISIGVVPMDIDRRTIHTGFYTRISLESAQDAGFSIDAGTVMWWLEQDEAARAEFKGNYAHPSIDSALEKLSQFISSTAQVEDISEIRVWGNGVAMDNVLLLAAFDKCGQPRPWTHRGDMCYRTVKNLVPHIPRVAPTVPHHALFDAEAQALTLFAQLDALGL